MPRKGGYLTFRVSTWYIKVSAALCIALWHRRANRSATCCSTALNIFEGMFQSVGVLYWGSTCCTQLQTGHRVQELCFVQSVCRMGCVPNSMAADIDECPLCLCSPAVWWLLVVVCLSFLIDSWTLVSDPMIFSVEWVKWMILKQYFSTHRRLYKCWSSFRVFCPGQHPKQMRYCLPEFNW